MNKVDEPAPTNYGSHRVLLQMSHRYFMQLGQGRIVNCVVSFRFAGVGLGHGQPRVHPVEDLGQVVYVCGNGCISSDIPDYGDADDDQEQQVRHGLGLGLQALSSGFQPPCPYHSSRICKYWHWLVILLGHIGLHVGLDGHSGVIHRHGNKIIFLWRSASVPLGHHSQGRVVSQLVVGQV